MILFHEVVYSKKCYGILCKIREIKMTGKSEPSFMKLAAIQLAAGGSAGTS